MNKKNIRNFAACCMASVIVLTGCGASGGSGGGDQDANNNRDADYQVALVVGLGGLGDQSFNDGLYAGVQKAVENHDIGYQVIEPTEYTEFNDNFMSLAGSGDYDLIIGCGYDAMEGLGMAAEEYPDQQFVFIDGAVEGCSNVTNYTFRDNEKTFLVGMMAALKSETGKIGLVMGTDTPDQHVFVAGYLAGAQYVKPDIDIDVKYVGSFTDISKAKELAIAMSEDGVDIIYAAAGGAGAGVYSTAGEYGYLSIGTDSNLCPKYPDTMFLSAYRNMEVVVADSIDAAMAGEKQGETVSVGLAEEAVGITNEGSNVETDPAFFEQTDEAKEAIISGEIIVPNSLE